MILLLKLALALLEPPRSPDWLDERAHVTCYQIADSVMSASEADRYCSDGTDPADY